MKYETTKSGSPIHPEGSQLEPGNFDIRSVVAMRMSTAVRLVGAPASVQIAAGDAAFCGCSSRDIELKIIKAGGVKKHVDAAQALPATVLRAIPKSSVWWPLGDGQYDHLQQFYVAQNHARAVQAKSL